MARANALVGRWMAEAGMAVRVDAAGNLVGHLPGSEPDAGTLLLGSHLDTVRDAGAFDGPLGVLAAIACVARLRAEDVDAAVRGRRARLLRRGGAALRHRVPRQPRGRRDARRRAARGAPTRTACTVRAALGAGRGGRVAARRAAARLLRGAHRAGAGARGARRAGRGGRGDRGRDARGGHVRRPRRARRHGADGAAGATPRARWRSSCSPSRRPAGRRRGSWRPSGSWRALPGAPNVIPGAAIASLDVRHADDAVRADAVAGLRARAAAIAAARGVAADVGGPARHAPPWRWTRR